MQSRHRGEETRERILAAAAESFAQNGYDATGVAQICRQAEVTKGAFYHHFPSKQSLFLVLFERWLAGLDGQLASARAGSQTVPEALRNMVGMARQVFEVASGQLPMFLEFWTQAARDPAIWQETIAPYQRYRAFFSGMVEAGIAEGSLRRVDPDVAALVIVSLAVGLVLQGVLSPPGADWGRVAEESIELLLDGLGRSG